MSKMHYFSANFSKIARRWGLHPQRSLTSDFGDLKLRGLTKLWFFKLIMTKLTLKNQFWRHFSDAIVITLPKIVTKITSQDFPFCPSTPIKVWLRQWFFS